MSLSICICVPLFHPFFTLIFMLIIIFLNTAFIITYKYMKFSLSLVFRVLYCIFLFFFNATIILIELYNRHFSKFSIKIYSALGYMAIIFITLSILFEFIEIVSMVFYDICKFTKKKICSQKSTFDD